MTTTRPAVRYQRCRIRGRQKEFGDATACPVHHAAIIDEGAVACGRIFFKERQAGAVCAADCGAIVNEGAVACGRISFKERQAGGSPPGGAAVVREGGEASGGRVVSENYVSEEFGSMRNEILDDPRIVHDTRTAKGEHSSRPVAGYDCVCGGGRVKMMLLTSVLLEIETSMVLERPNVAMSAGPLGTPIGVQLAAVFQSPEVGSRSHWALIA